MTLLQSLILGTYPFTPQSGAGPSDDATLTLAGDLITDAVRAVNEEGDGGTPPEGVGTWPAATNLVTNGGFETNTTGWTNVATGVLSRITSDAKFGAACGSVAVAAQNDGVRFRVTGGATQNQAYAVSCWVKAATAGDVGGVVQLFVGSAGGTFEIPINTGSVVLTADWQYIRASGTWVNGSHTAADVTIRTTSAGAQDFLIDGFQYETGSIATPYIETDGGTASRTAGEITVPRITDLLSETQGWVHFALEMGWASTVNPGNNPTVAMWGDDDNNRLSTLIVPGSPTTIQGRRFASGSGNSPSLSVTFARGDFLPVTQSWTATTLRIASLNQGDTEANTTIPTLTEDEMTWGYDGQVFDSGLGRQISSSIRWACTGSGTLTEADELALGMFGFEPPTWAGLVGALPATAQVTGLWPAVTAAYQEAG